MAQNTLPTGHVHRIIRYLAGATTAMRPLVQITLVQLVLTLPGNADQAQDRP